MNSKWERGDLLWLRGNTLVLVKGRLWDPDEAKWFYWLEVTDKPFMARQFLSERELDLWDAAKALDLDESGVAK